MIQFNLLPDLKLQFVKAQRMKRLVTLVSIAVSAVSIFALIIMFSVVNVVQRKSLNDLNSDISQYSNQLNSVQDLDKILTVQNQLKTLPTLHDKKVVASRLFTYMNQLTPARASINSLNVNFVENTMTISGQAPSLDVVNTYIDTLKSTTYKAGDTDTKAFKSVVLSAFSRTENASYTITASFDPAIFSSDNDVNLKVPAGTTVDPAAVFKQNSGN